jgi:hypothetical protein
VDQQASGNAVFDALNQVGDTHEVEQRGQADDGHDALFVGVGTGLIDQGCGAYFEISPGAEMLGSLKNPLPVFV